MYSTLKTTVTIIHYTCALHTMFFLWSFWFQLIQPNSNFHQFFVQVRGYWDAWAKQIMLLISSYCSVISWYSFTFQILKRIVFARRKIKELVRCHQINNKTHIFKNRVLCLLLKLFAHFRWLNFFLNVFA